MGCELPLLTELSLHDVVVLVDSLTRLARAYQLSIGGGSRSGSADTAWVYPTKKLFGAARNVEGGGSLTMVANVVMANVPGSPTTRWIGDVEVVDFISYAVLVQPIGLNVTVYSYDGRMSIGVLTAPEVLDDPGRFLQHMGTALDAGASAVLAASIFHDGVTTVDQVKRELARSNRDVRLPLNTPTFQ